MAVRNIKHINPEIIIPLIASPLFEVTIERDDGTIDTVTEDMIDGSVILSGTTQLSSFELELANTDGKYKGLYNGGEYVNFYLDYTDGTTLYFRGRIDKYFYSLSENAGFTLQLAGRDYPKLGDESITIQFVNAEIIEAFKGTSGDVDSNGNYEDGLLFNTGITWHPSNPSSVDIRLTKSYIDQKQIKIFGDVAQRGLCDWYIYYDTSSSIWYFRLFSSGSVTNTTDSAGFGVNVVSVNGIGKDLDDEYNRVRLYGSEDENIFYLRTENNLTSQSNLWIKDRVLHDNTLTNMTEIDEKIDYEISTVDAEKRGSITTLPLMSLKPGEKLNIVVPFCDVDESLIVKKITTRFSDRVTSNIELVEPEESIASFFKERIDENASLQPNINLNDMDNAYVIDFAEGNSGLDIDNTIIETDVLKLVDTDSPGTWESDTRDVDNSIDKIELRIKANYDIDESTFYISGDAGETWNEVTPGILYEYGNLGTRLKLKVYLNPTTDEPNPKIKKICILHRY